MRGGAQVKIVLDDEIEAGLGHAAWRLHYSLLAYARERNQGELLPYPLADRVARATGVGQAVLQEVKDSGLIVATPGAWFLTRYRERTLPVSTPRVQASRQRSRQEPPPNGTRHHDYQDETVSAPFHRRSDHVSSPQETDRVVDLDDFRAERLDARSPEERMQAIAGWWRGVGGDYPKRATVAAMARLAIPLTVLLLELQRLYRVRQQAGKLTDLNLLYRMLQERERELMRAAPPAPEAGRGEAGFQRLGYASNSSPAAGSR